MEEEDTRFVQALDERQQVHAGVPEINVHQIGSAPGQKSCTHLILAAIHDGRSLFDPFQPAVPERIGPRFWNQLDIAKWEKLGVLERLGHDERVVLVKRAHLPIDVEHLRFKEGGAITGYDSLGHRNERRLSVKLRKLSTCYSQAVSSEVVGSGSPVGSWFLEKSHCLRRSLKSVKPSDWAAEIATTSTLGKRWLTARRFSSAPGRSILLAMMYHCRCDRRGS